MRMTIVTNTSPGGEHRTWTVSDTIAVIALVVSLVSAGIAVFQTQRANDISDNALALSRALAPAVDVYAYVIDGSLSERDGQPSIRTELELVNTGEVHLSGCNTLFQHSDADGIPIGFWPAINESGGESWDVAPGGKHISVVNYPLASLQSADPGANALYLAVWFECKSSGVVTEGQLFGIDQEKSNLIPPPLYSGDEVHAAMRTLPPLGAYERASAVARASGQTPFPRPQPTPHFTMDPAP